MFLRAVFFDCFQSRGRKTCKNLGFSAIVAANIVKTDVFEQAGLRRGNSGSGAGAGKRRRREEAAHFLHASAHTSIELRWPPLTPLAEHSHPESVPLDSDPPIPL